MFTGFSARLVVQAAYFLVLARQMGATDYGSFIGTVVLLGIAAPLASAGTGHIMVRDVAIDPARHRYALGDALSVTVFFGGLLSLALAAPIALIAPDSVTLGLLVLLLASDAIVAPLADVCAQAFQARSELRVSALLQFSGSGLRLAAAIGLWVLERGVPLGAWIGAYALAGLVNGALALALAARRIGIAPPSLSRARRAARDGWLFSVMASSQAANADADKSLLIHFASSASAGVYSAAYRLVDVGLSPVRAMMYSAYAHFFAAGARNRSGPLALARRLARPVGLYCVALACLTWSVAPLVPTILGSSFSDSAVALRWLSPLIVLRGLQTPAADALAGLGDYRSRAGLSTMMVLANVALNAWLIPLHGWRGAAFASIACDGLLLAGFWLLLVRRSAHDSIPKAA